MLTYKITPVRKKKTFIETVIYTDYGPITGNILINSATDTWTLNEERFQKGYLEMRQYGPAKVVVFRMPDVENPESFAAEKSGLWSEFLSAARNGSFDTQKYMSLCEKGFPSNVSENDIDNVFSRLGMNRSLFDAKRKINAESAVLELMTKADKTGYLSDTDKEKLSGTLKENGCYLAKADQVRNFCDEMNRSWIHVSLPVYPTQKYVFFNDSMYEIRNFYKRPHGQKYAGDKKYEEDISWSVSLGLKKFDWVSTEVCWRLSCKNIVDTDAGKELLLKAFSIKDDRSAYFNSVNAIKEVRKELLSSVYGSKSEYFSDDADLVYDNLLTKKVIVNCVREAVVEDENGNIVFVSYIPGDSLVCHTVRKEDCNDNLNILTAALDIHKRTIKNTRSRLEKSDIYIAVKRKAFFNE